MHRRFTSFVAHVLVACVPVLGLVTAVGAGTASAAHSPVNARAAALAALKHLKIGKYPTDHVASGHSVNARAQQSSNWSGYADTKTSSKYSQVTGSWTEPRGTCGSTTTSAAAFWVGIDGDGNKTVEQDGTLVECVNGTALYASWFEMFPANLQFVGTSVKPGDHITSSVTRTGTKYTLKLTDSTNPANSFTVTKNCAATTCKDASAEWIAEAPSGTSGVLPLTNFGTWTLAGAAVQAGSKSGTIKTFPDQEITMIDGSGQVKAQPGALNSAGNQFKVTFKRST